MSPASKDENTSQAEPEAAEEATAAEPAQAAAKAAEAAPEAAEAAPEPAEAASGAEAGQAEQEQEAKPARRRAAAKPAAKADGPQAGGAATKAPAKAKKAPSSTEVKVELPAQIFDANVNVPLIHQVVVAQQAAARQGTHAAKTRGEVRGGGKKPYRQKGTGRARQGSIRAPQFAGGGVVHGPVSRSHAVKTPKKMKAAALRGALSDRARHGLVQVVGGFVDGDRPKTGDAVAVLSAVTGAVAGTARVLVVADRGDQVTWKSLRNARGVHLIDPGQLNTYDVLAADRVVFTSAAYESFVARAGGSGGPSLRDNGAGHGSEER